MLKFKKGLIPIRRVDAWRKYNSRRRRRSVVGIQNNRTVAALPSRVTHAHTPNAVAMVRALIGARKFSLAVLAIDILVTDTKLAVVAVAVLTTRTRIASHNSLGTIGTLEPEIAHTLLAETNTMVTFSHTRKLLRAIFFSESTITNTRLSFTDTLARAVVRAFKRKRTVGSSPLIVADAFVFETLSMSGTVIWAREMVLAILPIETSATNTYARVTNSIIVTVERTPCLILACSANKALRTQAGALNAQTATMTVLRALGGSRTVGTDVRWETKTFTPITDTVIGAVRRTRDCDVTRGSSPSTTTDTLSMEAHSLRIVAVVWTLFLQLARLAGESREAGTRAINTGTVAITAIDTEHLATVKPSPAQVALAV